jgi:hypothetical protein
LRNYIKLFGSLVRQTGLEIAFNFDYTEEDGNVTMEGFRATYIPNDSFEFIGPLACFFEFNKANAQPIINAARSLGFQGLIDLHYMVVGDSPRATWNSNDKNFVNLGKESASGVVEKAGTKRGGSRKSATTVSLAVYLSLLYQTYLAENKFSVANQVLTELNALNSGRLTESQVLDFLDKLPPTQ